MLFFDAVPSLNQLSKIDFQQNIENDFTFHTVHILFL